MLCDQMLHHQQILQLPGSFFRRTMPFRRKTLVYFLVLLPLVLLQYVMPLDDAFHGCSLPEDNATVVNFTSCKLVSVPNELKRYKDLASLDLSRNFLTTANLDFSLFAKLVRIDLSYNSNLGHSNITGFTLNSPSARILDLSYSGFGIIEPSSLQHLPNLRHLILAGNQDCEATRKLLKSTKPRIKVICAGIARNPVIRFTTFSPLYSHPSTNKPSLHPSEESTSSKVMSSNATTPFLFSTRLATSPATPQNITTPVIEPPIVIDIDVKPVGRYPMKHILRLVVSIVMVAILIIAWIFVDETVSMLRRICSFRAPCVRRTVG